MATEHLELSNKDHAAMWPMKSEFMISDKPVKGTLHMKQHVLAMLCMHINQMALVVAKYLKPA